MALSLLMRSAVLSAALLGISAEQSPVAKVMKLLTDLKKEVETDGSKEAAAYDTFACFCKDTTAKKSKSITTGADKISTLSASIVDDTATKEAKQTHVKERKATNEQLGTELSDTVSRCSTAHATYEADAADMAKAVASLTRAVAAMSAKKDKIGAASLIAQDKDVQFGIALAKQKGKLDPSDPAYKYHSKEINEILAKLMKDFKDNKADIEDKWSKTNTACTEQKGGLQTKMQANKEAIDETGEKIAGLQKTIAKARGDLVNAHESLQEDEAYLKDLTSQCETKATDFDQRASMRNDEVQALAQALAIMGNKVEAADKDVNKRALVQSKVALKAVVAPHVSLLQATPVKPITNFLARQEVSASEQLTQDQVVSLLRNEGNRLLSPELSAMAMRITEDHFKEVKVMIQGLIERLLAESTAEASKKGFCDKEIATAKKDRDHAHQEVESMGAELKVAEARKEEFEAELKRLKKEIGEENTELSKALGLRQKESKVNAESLKTAQDGLSALNEAILILKSFYSQAGRARVLLQISADPGFGGAYQGKQKSSGAIFALLENIATDFQRTISKTEQSEADAAAEFVKLDRTAKENVASKETKTKLDEQDLRSTNNNIANTLDDLKTSTGLVDDALKMIESLKPACLDAGGMNFKARTAKRNEEVAALQKAMCMLTPGKKEGDCK